MAASPPIERENVLVDTAVTKWAGESISPLPRPFDAAVTVVWRRSGAAIDQLPGGTHPSALAGADLLGGALVEDGTVAPVCAGLDEDPQELRLGASARRQEPAPDALRAPDVSRPTRGGSLPMRKSRLADGARIRERMSAVFGVPA